MIEDIINVTEHHDSDIPVSIGIYTVVVAMNESDPSLTKKEYEGAFAAEFQRALDEGYFIDLRFDAMDFQVTRQHIMTIGAQRSDS